MGAETAALRPIGWAVLDSARVMDEVRVVIRQAALDAGAGLGSFEHNGSGGRRRPHSPGVHGT